MPINYKKYDRDWWDKIRPAVLKRANYKCENCKRANHTFYVIEKGVRVDIIDDFMYQWYVSCGIKPKQVILSISHQNHNIKDNRMENLKALCQACHLAHDREYHRLRRLGKVY